MLRKFLILFCVSSIWASSLKAAKDLGPRIINGNQAVLGQFPWQVALSLGEQNVTCGGAIISEEWILTAAHCLDGKNSATVTVGSVIRTNPDNEYSASEFIIHQTYNPNGHKDDIGLIKLSKPLTFNDNVQPIALASDDLEAGVDVTVAGWGITKDGSRVPSDNLNYVTLTSITKEECESQWGGPHTLYDSMVCAKYVGSTVQSPCEGDSGGALVADASSNPVHVAIACMVNVAGCESGIPAIFTQTASYRDWIKTNSGV